MAAGNEHKPIEIEQITTSKRPTNFASNFEEPTSEDDIQNMLKTQSNSCAYGT